MQSLHLGLGRHLNRFPVGLASRACLAIFLWPFWTHGRANVFVSSYMALNVEPLSPRSLNQKCFDIKGTANYTAAQSVANCHTRGVMRGERGA